MGSVSSCLLILPDGKLVFQRRTADAPISAHKLDFFGGHHEVHESYEETVKRELSEETSLLAEHMQIKYAGKCQNPTTGTKMHLYIAHIKTPDFKVYEGEREEVYLLEDALKRSDIDLDTRVLLEKYKEHRDA
jgi:8-oxo-dGTP pyrophosphatase MutT (NUDIX family)